MNLLYQFSWIIFDRNLDLESCVWDITGYFDMSELLSKCGGHIRSDGQVCVAYTIQSNRVNTYWICLQWTHAYGEVSFIPPNSLTVRIKICFSGIFPKTFSLFMSSSQIDQWIMIFSLRYSPSPPRCRQLLWMSGSLCLMCGIPPLSQGHGSTRITR